MDSEISYDPAPTLVELHRSQEFVRGIIGPIGSGKSVGCTAEVFSRILEQAPSADGKRRSRWAIIRNTYRELQDTTKRTWLDWVPPHLGRFREVAMTHELRFNDVEADVIFRALDRPDDIKKLLSLELTGAWVNEAREIPLGVIEMLTGRVGRYPSKRAGGPTWYGVLMDTNPCDSDHWWYKKFEEDLPDEWQLFKQPGGLSPEAENKENLPPRYYERLMAGKDQEWINVYVHGKYGFVSDGKPIYPEYKDDIHTVHRAYNVIDSTVEVGIDFGLTPAATFAQRQPDGQRIVFDELVTENMGATMFAKELSSMMRQHRFKGLNFEITGDPAGEQRSQVDERTPFDVLHVAGIPGNPASTNDFTIRRDAVANNLLLLTLTGKPALVVHQNCKMLRKAMNGGYKYRRVQMGGDERFHDKPDKGPYSHVAESLQYLMLGTGAGHDVIIPTKFRTPKVKPSISYNRKSRRH